MTTSISKEYYKSGT